MSNILKLAEMYELEIRLTFCVKVFGRSASLKMKEPQKNPDPKWRKKVSLQGTNISPQKWDFEDDFPFPKVGYVNSLEGILNWF